MKIFNLTLGKKYKNLTQAVERKKLLIEQKESLLTTITSEDQRLKVLEHKIRDERCAARGYSNPDVSRYKSLKLQCESNIANFCEEQRKILSTYEKNNSVLKTVSEELDNIDLAVSANEVIEHQNSVIKRSDMVEKIQRQVDEQTEIINDRGNTGVETLSLYNQKAEILADIAQGADKRDELKNISTEITELEKEKSKITGTKEAAAREAEQVKAILEQRLQKERQGLERQNEYTSSVIDQFLMTEAKRISKEYLVYAHKMRKHLLRLAAIQNLIIDQKERNGDVILPANIIACIPNLSPGFSPKPTSDGILFDGRIIKDNKFMATITKNELERFEAMGIVSITSR